LRQSRQTPEAYRPPCCPHCGLKILWQHGHYERKADRRAGQVLTQSGADLPLLLLWMSAHLFASAGVHRTAPLV
jgi:hypothetical protein